MNAQDENIRDSLNQQDIQRQRARELQIQEQQKLPDERLSKSLNQSDNLQLPEHDLPCFVIKRLTLVGDLAEKFQWLLEPLGELKQNNLYDENFKIPIDPQVTGRCIGSSGINVLMEYLQNRLITAGYVTTRILASDQDLSTGDLKLTIVPGRIEAIRFKDVLQDYPQPYHYNALPIALGDILNLRDIEQGLENFKRVPGVEADIQIKPAQSQQPGMSDLKISWKQNKHLRLSISLDDSGSRSAGRLQSGLTITAYNKLHLNDLLYATFNRNLDGRVWHGNRATTTHYSFPLGYGLVALNYTESNYYQSVAGANQSYRYSGKNRQIEAKYTNIILRNGDSKTSLGLKMYQKTSISAIDDTEIEVQRRKTIGLEVNLSHKHYFGDATLDFNLTYRQGTRVFGGIPAPEEAFGEGTGRPRLSTVDLSARFPMKLGGQIFRYDSSIRAQWNHTRLILQDRFAIGGRHTVRGFDGESSLSAERGYLWRNDFSWSLHPFFEPYFGVDYGVVDGPAIAYLLGKRLLGGVFGIRGENNQLQYDIFIGKPFKKPQNFHTEKPVTGFNLNWQIW